MTRELDGKPKIGSSARSLGVREPREGSRGDLPVVDGMVVPGTGGMSVSKEWSEPFLRLPKRYFHPTRFKFGLATNLDSVWVFGLGSFEAAPISLRLQFRPDRPKHGLIEPLRKMPLDEFQAALASTRTDWFEVPDDGDTQSC